MHLKFTWWSFALLVLILEGNNKEIIADKVEKGFKHSHMEHSVLVFFSPEDLKVGKVMPIYFRGVDSSLSPHFLPREEADLIPFSTSKLSLLLNLFGFPQGSPQAKAMEDTLRQCEVNPIKGETKFCATSVESMLEFVRLMLMTEFRGLSTRQMTKLPGTNSNHELQNYTITDEPKEILAPKMVACHTMPYPYAVFYCHYQESESKVFKVKLTSDEENVGSKLVEAIAVCHMDTSQWSQNHVSFQVLGIKPGSSPVCHFFPADNLVWVPSINKDGDEEIA